MEDRPEVTLTGEDGNAFFIIGKCLRAARKARWSAEKIAEVQKEFISGDYDKVLQTAMKYFDVI